MWIICIQQPYAARHTGMPYVPIGRHALSLVDELGMVWRWKVQLPSAFIFYYISFNDRSSFRNEMICGGWRAMTIQREIIQMLSSIVFNFEYTLLSVVPISSHFDRLFETIASSHHFYYRHTYRHIESIRINYNREGHEKTGCVIAF